MSTESTGFKAVAAAEECAQRGSWTFLTNHSHVLFCLAKDPEITLRNVALKVGITERAVQRIVADLEACEIVTRERDGRRNRYAVHLDAPLRHDMERHRTVRDMMIMVYGQEWQHKQFQVG